ncbi:MAG: peroxide stress protein YaaA [Actinobacteria bacterium]|nr:peroxide stress protein YaaA [Actinomycetota bacterium]
MRILLPPSETKIKGGHPTTGLPTLSFSSQDPGRANLMDALESWSRDSPEAAAKALKLGPKSIDELANNVFQDAELLPAIDRYTGVLYSATGVAEWTPEQRDWAATHVFIHSALFGVISSADPIPVYRLSYDTKVAGRALKEYWGVHVHDALREMGAADWVLDCRSAGYRELAPIPTEIPSAYLEVVSANGGKALNHFNKIHKGQLVAALVAQSPHLETPEALVSWANSVGIDVRHTLDSMTLLV